MKKKRLTLIFYINIAFFFAEVIYPDSYNQNIEIIQADISPIKIYKDITEKSFTLITKNLSIDSRILKRNKRNMKGKYTSHFIMNQAFYHFYRKEYTRAKTFFERYIYTFNDHEVPLRFLAKIEISEANFENAIKLLKRAIELNDKDIYSLQLLAEIYLKEKDTLKSIEYLKKILNIDPLHDRALIILAKIYEAAGEGRKASVLYKKLIIVAKKKGDNLKLYSIAYTNLGRFYYGLKKFKKSIRYYEKLVELDNNNINYLLNIARLYKIKGQFAKSVKSLENLLIIKPSHETALLSIIESYYILDNRKALLYCKKFFKISARRPYLLMALFYELNKNGKKAKSKFIKVLKKNPNRLSARIGLLRIYIKEYDYALIKKEAFKVVMLSQKIQAFKIAQKYIKYLFKDIYRKAEDSGFESKFFHNNPERQLFITDNIEALAKDFIDLFLMHATTMERLKYRKQAISYYFQALKYLDQLQKWYKWKIELQENNLGLAQRGALLAVKLKNEAKKLNSNINKVKYKSLQTLISIAWVLQNDKNTFAKVKSSLNYMNRAIQIYPERAGSYFYKGVILLNHSEKNEKYKKEAFLSLKKALQLTKKKEKIYKVPSNYYFYLGMALVKMGDFSRAERYLEKAIKNDPYNSTYLNYLGYMYSTRSIKLKKARLLLDKALEDDPENEAYLDTYGWILYQDKQYKSALARLLLAVSQAEKKEILDSVIYFHLAETYYSLKEKSISYFYYKKALDNIDKASEKLNKKYLKDRLQELKSLRDLKKE